MKNMKKLASLLLALVMILALAAPALAADETTENATKIVIKSEIPANGTAAVQYNAYKIFDVVIGGSDQTNADAPHSYTIDKTNKFFAAINGATNIFELEQIGTSGVYNVTLKATNEEATAIALAEILSKVEDKGDPTATTNVHDAEGKYTLDVKTAGYYFITSSLGSKMIVDTVGAGQTLEINAKNNFPTLNKTITDITNGTVDQTTGKSGTASYGSVVTFNIAVAIPATAVGTMTVHDVMDEHLTYVDLTDASVAATVANGTETGDGVTACTKEFTISAETVKENLGKTVNVQYTATVNSNAPVDGTAMKNIAHLVYSDYTTPKSEVEVYTYAFDLVKTNSKNEVITGAVFDLYKVVGEEDVLVQSGIEVGTATINGLSNGAYKLVETKAPEGYNKLKDAYEFAINNASLKATVVKEEVTEGEATVEKEFWQSGGVHIENLTGAELPSTGGIGTTLFYIVGGLLIVGAAVLLITKKRVNGEQ